MSYFPLLWSSLMMRSRSRGFKYIHFRCSPIIAHTREHVVIGCALLSLTRWEHVVGRECHFIAHHVAQRVHLLAVFAVGTGAALACLTLRYLHGEVGILWKQNRRYLFTFVKINFRFEQEDRNRFSTVSRRTSC